MNVIEMPPDAAALMESTRAIGYSLPTAAADLIDNSIAAGAKHIDIFYLPSKQYIALLDDGCGMDSDELNIAMKYGGRSPLDNRKSIALVFNRYLSGEEGLKPLSITTFDGLWVIDVKKSSVLPPAIVRENLDRVIERLSMQSRETVAHRGRKETDDKIRHMWNRLKTRDGRILYEINKQHPMVQQKKS